MKNYKKLYNSLKKRTSQLERQNKELLRMNDILVAEKKQWLQQKELQDQIISQHLATQGNDTVVEQLQNEIRRLKKEYNIKD